MKRRGISLVWLSLLIGSASQGLAFEAPKDFEAPGGVWWRAKSKLTVTSAYSLRAPLALTADEILVDAPIVTNGFALDLQTRHLVFGKAGKIVAFTEALPALNSLPPEYDSAAAMGEGEATKGSDGVAGRPGFAGLAGMGSDRSVAGEIVVFAAALEGNPFIDGTGQTGGRGGAGGKGQKGGTGGRGKKANARVILSSGKAGKGGTGGGNGKGGSGGPGGQGGAPVPVAFLLAIPNAASSLGEITSRAGSGGEGGAPGKPGEAGEGGPGGEGDKAAFLFFSHTEPGGAEGDKGAFSPADLGPGPKGIEGPSLPDTFWLPLLGRPTPLHVEAFPDFEGERFKVSMAWAEFHWWRLFEWIARSSVQLLVPDAPDGAPDKADGALNALLGGDLDVGNLRVISDRWENSFFQPLRRELASLNEAEIRVRNQLAEVITLAETYTEVLRSGSRVGALAAPKIRKLQETVNEVSKRRAARVAVAVDRCDVYQREVLGTERYRNHLAKRQAYFEVPVCRAAGQFLDPKNVQAPIELAEDLVPAADLENSPEFKIERSIAPDVRTARFAPEDILRSFFEFLLPSSWAADPAPEFVLVPLRASRLRPAQLREFRPRRDQSTVVGGLGVHKGFVLPKGKIKPGDLDDLLRELVLTL